MAKTNTKKSIKGNTKKTEMTNAKKTTSRNIKNNTTIKVKTEPKKRSQGKEVMQRIETGKAKESKKMLIILACVIAVLALFYLIAGVATGSIDLNKNEPAAIQYSEILAGSTFKQTESEYMVLYYDYTGDKTNDYMNLISTYTQKKDAKKFFAVDLSRKFNESYIQKDGDKTNTEPKEVKDLKVKDPTLIHIKDKKVIKYIEDYKEIEDYLS